jgi:hypothetical protein
VESARQGDEAGGLRLRQQADQPGAALHRGGEGAREPEAVARAQASPAAPAGALLQGLRARQLAQDPSRVQRCASRWRAPTAHPS